MQPSTPRWPENVLGGDQGPARDIVILNAAAALTVAGIAEDLPDGLQLAAVRSTRRRRPAS
jgi:anthranilate phosphoribosyltransferase